MKKYRVFVLLLVAIASLVGASFAETTSTAYLVTTSSSINDSIVHIINSSEVVQSFTGTLYNGDGIKLGASKVALHTGTIAPNARLILSATDLEGLFNVAAWTGPAMLEVFGQSSLEVMIKLKSPSGFISNTNCVTEDDVRNIEGYETSDITFVRLINTGSSTISNITATLYDKDGNAIGTPDRTLASSLRPKQQVWIDRWQLYNIFQQEWTSEASLVVSDHSDLKLLNLNFVNSETFFNFSCYDDTNTNPKNWEFSKTSPAAIEAINGWFERNGLYSQTVSGANGFSAMETDTFGGGLWASLKVKSANCPSFCAVRLDRNVGYYNGNLLRAEIRIGKWGDNQVIDYRVREVDSSGNTLYDSTKGYFGTNTGQHWVLNETIVVAIALEGNEFIFYTDNYDQIAKLQLLGPITPLQTPRAWRVSIWTQAANDSMTAEASGFLAVNASE